MVLHDWKLNHEVVVSGNYMEEVKLNGQFGFCRNFGFKVYDGSGNYVFVRFSREGTEEDAKGRMFMIFLPSLIVIDGWWITVGGADYEDVFRTVIWKKDRGAKFRIEGSGITVGLVIRSNATITQVDSSTFKAGDLYIRVQAGTATLDTGNNILKVEGSVAQVSVAEGAPLDVPNNAYGFTDENLSTTETEVTSGFRVIGKGMFDGKVFYFRWDELGTLIDVYHDSWFTDIVVNGVELPWQYSECYTYPKNYNALSLGLGLFYGHRTQPYFDSDAAVPTTYQMYGIPDRLVFAYRGNYFGFAAELHIYRATGAKMLTTTFAITYDLVNKKALVTREINAVASFTTYQEAGNTVSMAIIGTGDWGGLGVTPSEWGYKYWDGSSWVEVTSLPSTWRFDNTYAGEFKYKTTPPCFELDKAYIVVIRSLKSNRTDLTPRSALAGDYEMYFYIQLGTESYSPGDYQKEIYVMYFGKSADYGSTLESMAEIPDTLDSKDFNKTLNDLSDAQAYGFDTAVIYDPSTDTYSLATAGYPKFVLVDITPTLVNVKVGSTFTVTVTIRNEGTAPGTCKVSLIDHEGDIQDEKSKIIDPGQEATFTLTGVAPTYVTVVPYRIRWEAV